MYELKWCKLEEECKLQQCSEKKFTHTKKNTEQQPQPLNL